MTKLYFSAANFSSYFTASQVFFLIKFFETGPSFTEHEIQTEKIYHFSREQENNSVLVDIFSHFQMLDQIVANRKMTDIIFLFQKGQ